MSETVHGTAVLAGACGVLLRGASGSGKSQLAAQLIEGGALLVADDRVHLSNCHERIIATVPAAIAGRMEARGRGIVTVVHERSAVIRLVVDIVDEREVERMPEEDQLSAILLGVRLPRQPVANALPAAVQLVKAAIRALPEGRRYGLAVGESLGKMAALSPHMASR